jgi:hypothetical protein
LESADTFSCLSTSNEQVVVPEGEIMLSNWARYSLYAAVALAVLGTAILFRPSQKTSAVAFAMPEGTGHTVVIELFTSEGCSSCPPADTLLKRLSEQQPFSDVRLIALEEHVDYWNHLGWADPFSSRAFSDRQDQYDQALRTGGPYTPQMIVDGQFELVATHGDAAAKTIQKAAAQPKLDVAVSVNANSAPEKPVLTIQVSNPQGIPLQEPAEIWVAVTESNLQSDVKAGENSGETLKHAAVVRSLRKFETLRDSSGYTGEVALSVDTKWKRENLSAVIFVSEKKSHKMIGAASATLAPRG